MSLGEREHFEQAVHRLTEHSVPLPDFGGFHPAFLDIPEIHGYKPIFGCRVYAERLWRGRPSRRTNRARAGSRPHAMGIVGSTIASMPATRSPRIVSTSMPYSTRLWYARTPTVAGAGCDTSVAPDPK